LKPTEFIAEVGLLRNHTFELLQHLEARMNSISSHAHHRTDHGSVYSHDLLNSFSPRIAISFVLDQADRLSKRSLESTAPSAPPMDVSQEKKRVRDMVIMAQMRAESRARSQQS